MIERIWYCDAPGCKNHVRSAALRPEGLIFVTETWPGGQAEMNFDSWDCVLRYGATRDPVQTIELHDHSDRQADLD